MTLLHELPLLKGEMRVVGNVAYVAQQAWVFGASVRQNITFGAAFDSNKYNRVIKAAALSKVSIHDSILVTFCCCDVDLQQLD